MRKWINAIGVLAVVLAAACSLWLLISLASEFVSWILAQESEIAASLIATLGSVLAASLAYIVGQERSKSRDIAEAHRPRKVELYDPFLTYMLDFMQKSAKGGSPANLNDNPELLKVFTTFTKDLMLWGSPDVIQAWSRFRDDGGGSGVGAVAKFDDLIRAIRRDLGHNSWLLPRGSFVRLVISNPKTFDLSKLDK
jgi:hypothetical protein